MIKALRKKVKQCRSWRAKRLQERARILTVKSSAEKTAAREFEVEAQKLARENVTPELRGARNKIHSELLDWNQYSKARAINFTREAIKKQAKARKLLALNEGVSRRFARTEYKVVLRSRPRKEVVEHPDKGRLYPNKGIFDKQ